MAPLPTSPPSPELMLLWRWLVIRLFIVLELEPAAFFRFALFW